MKTFLSIIITLIIIATSTLRAQTTTLTFPGSAQAQQTDIQVLAGETLEVLAWLSSFTEPRLIVNGVTGGRNSISYNAFQNMVFAGAASVSALVPAGGYSLVFTYRKTVVSSVATQNIPSQTVAIPENTIEPADVILESSTDLNSWISALPGSFTPSALKRFFRLRLVLH